MAYCQYTEYLQNGGSVCLNTWDDVEQMFQSCLTKQPLKSSTHNITEQVTVSQEKPKKSVTFSNKDLIIEYTSPYCNSSFLPTQTEVPEESSKRYRHVYLNPKEREIVEMFYANFEVTYNPAESLTSDQIYNWSGTVLKRHGQCRWNKHARKWSHVVGRINLYTSLWKHRDQPLVTSPQTLAPPLSVGKVQRKLF